MLSKSFQQDIDNPLIWPILSLLENSTQSWKVHHLMVELRQKAIMKDLDQNYQLDLFKRNFLIMNALYQLQEILLPTQWLQVQSMDIRITQRDNDIHHQQIDIDDPLRKYYLDWCHYCATHDDIKRLLSSFWQRYQHYVGHNNKIYIERKNALAALGLTELATDIEIRRQWRKMALKWHPDRPKGDANIFRTMCEAWQNLRLSL